MAKSMNQLLKGNVQAPKQAPCPYQTYFDANLRKSVMLAPYTPDTRY
jgi:hypothetical protein